MLNLIKEHERPWSKWHFEPLSLHKDSKKGASKNKLILLLQKYTVLIKKRPLLCSKIVDKSKLFHFNPYLCCFFQQEIQIKTLIF